MSKQAPEKMSKEELEYRMMLQEAILWATQKIMQDRKEEIMQIAKASVQTLRELRGT